MPTAAAPVVRVLAALLAIAAPAAQAQEAAGDETLVVARDVMPRIAYHALEPTANPVRVQATVFPGRVFHGAMGGLVQQLVGDDELTDTAARLDTGREAGLTPGMVVPLAHGPALQGGGAGSSRAIGGSIGGAVLRATSGLGTRMSQAITGATSRGSGP